MPSRISDETILDAVVAVIVAQGYLGATTRSIAAAARVNEATLFRRFGDKDSLVAAAIAAEVARFGEIGALCTDDVEADLTRIVSFYRDVFRGRGRLLLVLLVEAHRSPELTAAVRQPLAVIARLREVVTFHQQAGRLVDEPASVAINALLGPLLMAAIAAQLEPGSDPFEDAETYVVRFLRGRRPCLGA